MSILRAVTYFSPKCQHLTFASPLICIHIFIIFFAIQFFSLGTMNGEIDREDERLTDRERERTIWHLWGLIVFPETLIKCEAWRFDTAVN